MVIFHSYVKLPEGTSRSQKNHPSQHRFLGIPTPLSCVASSPPSRRALSRWPRWEQRERCCHLVFQGFYGISWWFNGMSWWFNGISWWFNGISWWFNGISWWFNGISWWFNGISWWFNGISWDLIRCSGVLWWLTGMSPKNGDSNGKFWYGFYGHSWGI